MHYNNIPSRAWKLDYFLSINVIIITYIMAVGKTEVQRWVESYETCAANQRVPVLVL